MSGIASMAIPGRIPTFCSGGRMDPRSLFKNDRERAEYRNILNDKTGIGVSDGIKVDRVCVKIFDLSDASQVSEYEKLWAELLEKTSRNEVIVESQKDLVRRSDGTSYWMKYVEYVEFRGADEDDVKDGNKDGERK